MNTALTPSKRKKIDFTPFLDAKTYAALKVVLDVDEENQYTREIARLTAIVEGQKIAISRLQSGIDYLTEGLEPCEMQLVSAIITESAVVASRTFLVRPFDMQLAGVLASHVDVERVRMDKVIMAMRIHGFWWCELDYTRPPRLHTIAIVTNVLESSIHLENFANAHAFVLHHPVEYVNRNPQIEVVS